MADRFTEGQMLKLVETYRDYPCLWNVTSNLYKNRVARENAYKEIWEKLNIPGLKIKDIPKKIKNLRSSYYQEIKKIENSIPSGADLDTVYKPKVSWFTSADGFLKTFRIKQERFSNIDENSNTNSENDSETQNMEDSSNEDNSNTDGNDINSTGDNSNETNRIERHQNEIPPFEFIAPSRKPLKKRGKINKKQQDIFKAIDRIDKIAKNVTNTANSLIENKNKEDEFDIFAKYIAMTLRSLPGELAIISKTHIQKTLSDMQLRALRQNTRPLMAETSYGGTYGMLKQKSPVPRMRVASTYENGYRIRAQRRALQKSHVTRTRSPTTNENEP